LAKYDTEANVVELPKADHGYRNEQKEPLYQVEAIKILLQHLSNVQDVSFKIARKYK